MNTLFAILRAVFGNWKQAVENMDYMFYRDQFDWGNDEETEE